MQQTVCHPLPSPVLDATITSSLAVEVVDRGRRCVFLLFTHYPLLLLWNYLLMHRSADLCGPTETCCYVWQEGRCDREHWCAWWLLRQSWYVVSVVLYLLNVVVTCSYCAGCVPKKVLQHPPRDHTLFNLPIAENDSYRLCGTLPI